MFRRYAPWIALASAMLISHGTLAWLLNDCRRTLVPGGWGL